MKSKPEFRCAHGFLRSKVRCSECTPTSADQRDPVTVERRRPPSLRITPGSTVAGAKIVSRLKNDRVEAICECGETYQVSRSSVTRHHRMGSKSRCWPCQQREMARALAERTGAA